MCVILYTVVNGKQILAKNRDVPHNPHIEIVHELVNGREIVYIKDLVSGWIEGMNGDGVGIINSTLVPYNRYQNRKKQISHKTNKIYKALCQTTKSDILSFLMKQKTDGKVIPGVEGHTLLYLGDKVSHIEQNKKNDSIIEPVHNTRVYSNHHLKLKEGGFTEGETGLSSLLRKKIVETELQHSDIDNLYDDVLSNIMNVNCANIDPQFHSYRNETATITNNKEAKPGEVFVNTTGQLLLNMTDNEFVYYSDSHTSKSVNYINNLPADYVPKIRIIIKETEKRSRNKKRCLTSKYVKQAYKKFNYSSTRKKSMHKNRSTRRK